MASVASPAIAEQKAELKETELPKDMPTETNDPDRVVSPDDSNKPKEDDSKVAAVQTSASMESEAAEATARQSLDDSAPKADVARAPNLGLGKDNRKLKAKWESKLSAYIKLHKRYPKVQKDKAAIVTVSLSSTVRARCCLPASSRHPATRHSMRPRFPRSAAPIPCRRRRPS